MGAEQIIVRGDSQLVIEQVQGEYEARGKRMKEYCQMAKDLVRKFSKVVLQRIPCLENEEVDRLARIASSEQLDPEVPFVTLNSPRIQTLEVNVLQTQASWVKPIQDYLDHNILPDDKLEAKRIKFKANRYVIFDGVLYKWGHTIPLLR